MSTASRFGALAAWAARNARAVLAVALVVALAAALAATRLPTDAGVDTLVDGDSPSYQETQEVREAFGEEPVVVLARGDLQQLILTDNLFRLLRLEGCLSGKVPKGAEALPGPCAELAEMEPVEFVAGPATFLNEAVVQIEAQLRRLSQRVPPEQLREFLLAVATRYGITSPPSIDNEEFVATVVFDLARERSTPKARLAYLFPNSRSATVVVRLKPDLSESERHRALELIDELVNETTPRRACAEEGEPAPCFQLRGGSYVVSGAPVVIDGVANALEDALLILFAVALVVMSLTLLIVFQSRWRLLPLAIALAAAALTFGLLRLFGGSLTMASIGALPILIGLAVDYAIQLQARFDEAVASDSNAVVVGMREQLRSSGVGAARAAAAAGGPTIGAACVATIAGFLALQLSPTPMVRDFGLLLVVGVAVAFLLALTVGFAALALRGPAPAPRGAGEEPPAGRGADEEPPADARGEEGRQGGGAVGVLRLALAHPGRVLAVGAVLAVIGWGLGTQIDTESDIRELAPQGLAAVEDLNELQDATGVSGELDVSIEAPDLSDPATIEWMADFKRRVLRANGFRGENPSCLDADLCPGPALSDFLTRGQERPTAERIDATLAAMSPYALRQVAPLDPRTGEIGERALISFGIRAQSLEDQQALIDRVREEIGEAGEPGGPPSGVEVELAGVSVIAAESASELSSSRYWLTLAGLAAVALALLAIYRSPRRALLPLVPTVMATGWASLLLWITGIPLNPMSAALGALTIAIATEFGVILSGRFHQERRRGGVEEALQRTYSRTGAAVIASGATAIAGFAVLIASDVSMLREFGFVTVIDLAAAMVGVMLVLPAALVWVEER